MALVALAASLYLAWSYRDAYAPMRRARVAPTSPGRKGAPSALHVAR